jgi:hypothetical protein
MVERSITTNNNQEQILFPFVSMPGSSLELPLRGSTQAPLRDDAEQPLHPALAPGEEGDAIEPGLHAR